MESKFIFKNLIVLRKQNKISQLQLSDAAHIPLKKIQKIEKLGIPEEEIDFNTVYKLSKFFNINYEDLFITKSEE